MLAGYCINTVTFSGEKQQQILDHFSSLEEHTPPFLSIMVYDDALHFDSRWIPPIRSLSEIAEQFDVSYEISYRVPYEDRGTYRYTCLQQQALSPPAEQLRELINASENREQLEEAESRLNRHVLAQSLDLHELEVLSLLTGKRYNSFRPEENRDRPWESDEPGTGRGLSR